MTKFPVQQKGPTFAFFISTPSSGSEKLVFANEIP